MEAEYEYAVFRRNRVLCADMKPHREFATERAAELWMNDWVADGGNPETFYIARRLISPWEPRK